MRISDWSSDVCSSDLVGLCVPAEAGTQGTYETRETLGSCFRRSTSSPPAHLPPRFGDFLDIVGDLDERRGIVAAAGVDHRLARALIEPGERFLDLAPALDIEPRFAREQERDQSRRLFAATAHLAM